MRARLGSRRERRVIGKEFDIFGRLLGEAENVANVVAVLGSLPRLRSVVRQTRRRMKKRRPTPEKVRPDADRRVRQCEKFAKILQLLRLLLGRGRWNAKALVQELECSPRTLHRYLNVLSMSGVPLHFDRNHQAYVIDESYRFPRFDQTPLLSPDQQDLKDLLVAARAAALDMERLLTSLRQVCARIETASDPSRAN